MLTRALIVLLVVQNLGVAAWWVSRPAALPPAPPQQPQGVAQLQLESEAPPRVATVAVPAQTAVEQTPPAPTETPSQCFSLGPFADEAKAKTAIEKLRADITQSHMREVAGVASSGSYTVFLPPAENLAAAQALAQRIATAGFNDFRVVSEGDSANSIALGLYRNRDGAQRRQKALQAAGFPAQLRTAGEATPSQWWADIAAKKGMSATQARSKSGAARTQTLDCAALR
jgi:hypothetical protein